MAKTIVGLVKSMATAQELKQALLDDGYRSESIRLVANEGSAAATVGSAGGNAASTGVIASIKNFFASFTEANEADQSYYSAGVSRGGAMVAVTVPDSSAEDVQGIFDQFGASNINERNASSATGTAQRQSVAATNSGDVAIPIVEEELLVGKRQVSRGGVRVYSQVVETPIEENIQLREEHVRIQRKNVDRPASEADFQTFKDGELELTETAEEAVVSKQARVVEEVTIGKDVTERQQTIKDKVRRTEVEVTDMAVDPQTRIDNSRK